MNYVYDFPTLSLHMINLMFIAYRYAYKHFCVSANMKYYIFFQSNLFNSMILAKRKLLVDRKNITASPILSALLKVGKCSLFFRSSRIQFIL